MRVETLRTGVAVAITVALFGWIAPRSVGAQVTITHEPDRPSLLFSADANQDCSALHVLEQDALPYHVVRLRAAAAGADGHQWSLPKPQVGFLLADQDLGPGESDAAVRGLCGEFGNACILTDKTLRLYDKDSILYAAPTCDVLSDDTRKQFGGGRVKIKVIARAGNKKVGKATTIVVFGDPTVGAVTLYAFGDDGAGKAAADGEASTEFTAVPAPLPPNGPVTSFDFTWAGAGPTGTSCDPEPVDPCVVIEEPLAGTFLATVRARLGDGSALCDNLNVRVGPCKFESQVQVIRVPTKKTYTSEDEVRLRVRFANLSPNGCELTLKGSNVLTCSATFKLGETEETKTTRWDFQHCSTTTTTPCQTNADCPSTEICLDYSHCSRTFTKLCDGDSDCEHSLTACATCEDNETCVRVLAIDEARVPPGQAIDLVDEDVIVTNKIGDPVSIKETWASTAFPPTTAETTIKYKIKGQ